MQIQFSKYQGTGNDFILLDNRDGRYSSLTQEQVAWLCHRRFGIGADGLMLVEQQVGVDFNMVYYNSDGRTSSMCGNGGRCITAFAKQLGIVQERTLFHAIDGLHDATIQGNFVSLKMIDVKSIESYQGDYILHTGSPHYVKLVDDVHSIDVVAMGRQIRNSERFKEAGINVNFVEVRDESIVVRTYERGVEDETYSCGTGVVASSLVASSYRLDGAARVACSTLGGDLAVSYEGTTNEGFSNIWLHGKAEKVFEGVIELR